ncbi:YcxB family protein [Bacillus sp. BRMEA1]|uniref:YcxB family protein n=1 Tax=Neobacillus endophyticus TaxID=2738405 RepID=UPI00156354B9|nr:YcxB family protein [Neobacillus endophyticus]NRD77664.1 YcxB family protein [Neobacillus endophyticus]
MELTYLLSEEDYYHFNLFHLKHSKAVARILTLQRLIGPVIFLIFAFIFTKATNNSLFGVVVTFLVLSILWVIFYPKYFYATVKRRLKKAFSSGKNAGLIGKHHLLLTDDGLTEWTGVGEMKFKWSGIEECKEDSDYFYLYNSAVSALIIPKRDLPNPKEFRAYLLTKI